MVQFSIAQSDSLPIYKRFPVLPVFSVIKVPDSSRFTKEDLPSKKRTVVIVFSPDCGHCQLFAHHLMDSISWIGKTQLLLVSHMEFSHIRRFYDEYKMAGHPQITLASDPNYFLGTYFSVRQYPSAYVYDKKGNFVKRMEGHIPIADLAE